MHSIHALVDGRRIDLDDAAVGIQDEDLREAGGPGRVETHRPRVARIRLRMYFVASPVSYRFQIRNGFPEAAHADGEMRIARIDSPAAPERWLLSGLGDNQMQIDV